MLETDRTQFLRSNIKLRDIAEHLVASGEVIPPGTRAAGS